MDIPKSESRHGFWEAYRACAEENRVRPDRSPFYVNWAKEFTNFLPERLLKDRSRRDIEAFLADLGKRKGIAAWQVRQAEHALRILYEIFLPQYAPEKQTTVVPHGKHLPQDKIAKMDKFCDQVIPGEVERQFSELVEAIRTGVRSRHYSYRTEPGHPASILLCC
jgi:hypothetical protein